MYNHWWETIDQNTRRTPVGPTCRHSETDRWCLMPGKLFLMIGEKHVSETPVVNLSGSAMQAQSHRPMVSGAWQVIFYHWGGNKSAKHRMNLSGS